MDDLISRQAAIEALYNVDEYNGRSIEAIRKLPSTQSDMAEKLYPYKCYITDTHGLPHEVIHTGDIRRVTGWEI